MVIKIFFGTCLHSISVNKAFLIYKDDTVKHLSKHSSIVFFFAQLSPRKLIKILCFLLRMPIHYLEKNNKLYYAITLSADKIDLI
jgi:hypothetical protein